MPAPTPLQLREAIVRARSESLSYLQIAELLGIGRATVNRVLRRQRESGGVDPRPRGGGNVSPIHGRIEQILHRIIEEMPDATVAELTLALIDRANIDTSRSGVQRALTRLGYSRKKSPSWQRSATPRIITRGGERSRRC